MVKTLLSGTWALKHKLAILILLLVYLGVFSCRAQAQDTTPPVFQSATINGDTLTATYNEDLENNFIGGGTFTGTVFVIRINGHWVGVSREGRTSERNAIVTLNYWSRARPGDRVTLSYMVPADPGASPLTDTSGNPAGPFTNFPVTNITPDDPPKLWQANLKDNKIILLYDDELNANWRPPTSAYRVVHEGVEVTVTKVDVTRSDPTSSVILTLGRTFHQTDANARVSYTAPPEDNNNAVQDRSGNRAASFTDVSAGNVTISTDDPKLVRVHTATDVRNPTRDIVYLRYDRILLPDGPGDMSNPFNPPASAYRVRVDGFPVAVTGTRINQSIVSLTLARRVTHRAQRVTVSYEIPALNPVRARGALAPPLTDYPVEISIPPSGSGTGGANGRDVFYGIMEVGQVDAMEGEVGFDNTVVGTSLTPDDFSFNGNIYDVELLVHNSDTDFLWLDLTGTLTEAEAAHLVLYVGGRVFRFADTGVDNSIERNEWAWSGANVSWEIGQIVPVLIVDTTAAGSALSVADVTVAERDGSTADFVVTLNPAASETVTVDYATSDGTATEGDDYTDTSGTLTFKAGKTSMTVSVPVLDDTDEDAGETIILTLSNPSGNAYLADATATGTISNHEAPTAQFPSLPDHHDGQAFATELTFSEPMAIDADSLSTALSITGGSLTAATATTDGDSRSWQVSVQPQDRQTDVVFRLATANDCTSTSILCSSDGQPLLKTLTATVAAAMEAPSVAGVAQVGAPLEASFAHAPGGALAWQWLRGSEPIAGAEGPTYTPTAADVGARLSVRVEAGGESATSAATATVWPAAGTPALADGEEELLSTTMTLGSYQSGFWLGGYGHVANQSFGEIAETSFEDGGTTYAVEQFFLTSDGSFTLTTDSRLSTPAGLVAYWNGYRISGLERTGLGGHLLGRTSQPENEYTRYWNGASDGVRVAVSLRRVTVAAQDALTAAFKGLPTQHDNAEFKFEIEFTETLKSDFNYKTLAGVDGHTSVLSVSNGEVRGARRLEQGEERNKRWEITIEPDGTGDIEITLPATAECTETGAICAAPDRPLSLPVTATVPGTVESETTAAEPFEVRFKNLPSEHDGENAIVFEVEFTKRPKAVYTYVRMRNSTLKIRRGDETLTPEVRRLNPPHNDRWEVTVEPGGNADLTVSIGPFTSCTDTGAVCTDEDEVLSNKVEETIHGPATPSVPFRVRLEGVPREHAGTGEIVFEVEFTKRPKAVYTYVRMRNSTLKIRRGDETLTPEVRRLNRPHNDRWEVTVEPGSKADLTVSIGPFTSCTDTGAVCTDEDEVLSNKVEKTILGPPGLSVSDARVHESEVNAAVAFTVTLSRAASETVTVDYATSDGTAEAGSDYQPTSDTLTFAVGDTVKTVSVAVLDDAVDEAEETFTLTLFRPDGGNAWLADDRATGTIENSDPMPRAWLARFGRTAAVHVLDAVEERLDGGSNESWVRLGGHQLGGVSPQVMESARRLAPERSLWDAATSLDPAGQDMSLDQLFLGSAFHLVSNAEDNPFGPRLSAWGRVATSGFDGEEDRTALSGTVTTATLGVDGVFRRWLTGVALAYSAGDGSFTHTEAPGGDLSSTLTSVHPYVGYALSDRVKLWGMVGYGSGSLELSLVDRDPLRTDIDMTMGALGVRGVVMSTAAGFELALRSDVLWVSTGSAAVPGMVETEADTSRVRLVLEGSRSFSVGEGGLLTPTLELGLRRDGGDAEEGSGVEVGGRLRYASSWGLSLEASLRALVAHEASEYQEWGASGALRYDPGQAGIGLTASVTPTWGMATSGIGRLWSQPDARGLAGGGAGLSASPAARVDAELGWGLRTLNGQGLLTPYARASLVEGSEHAWHLGTRLALTESLDLSLEASHRQRADEAAAQEVALRASLPW